MSENRLCPTCKKRIAPETELCPYCEQEFCPICLAPIEAVADRCAACGAEFELACPACGEPVSSDAERCEACGYDFEAEESSEILPQVANAPSVSLVSAALGAAAPRVDNLEDQSGLNLGESEGGVCPSCDAPVILEEGFCRDCGQPFCTMCQQPIDEEDEQCPHCGVQLYFDCSQCGFELTAGTEICPNCNTLFPSHCTNCGRPLEQGDIGCLHCETRVSVRQRHSARVLHRLPGDGRVVQIVACPQCGEQFDSVLGACPKCGFKLCQLCQIHLDADERFCPRCGQQPEILARQLLSIKGCPACGRPIQGGMDACPHCEQALCPACQAPIADDDVACAVCGAEFELACPSCGSELTVEASACPTCGFAFEEPEGSA
jgi:predicted amidophosphoribosyltransferase